MRMDDFTLFPEQTVKRESCNKVHQVNEVNSQAFAPKHDKE